MRRNKIILIATAVISLSACSASQPKADLETSTAPVQENPVPGTVTEPWVEPMYDHVEVPGQLDPKGLYYRPPHKTVMEVRPGKFQEVEFPPPDENNKSEKR